MIAFVEANAPFFTWTGAVFVASVAIGLVLWAVSGLWAAFWKWLDPYDLGLLHSTATGPTDRCMVCGDEIATHLWADATGQIRSYEACLTCGLPEND